MGLFDSLSGKKTNEQFEAVASEIDALKENSNSADELSAKLTELEASTKSAATEIAALKEENETLKASVAEAKEAAEKEDAAPEVETPEVEKTEDAPDAKDEQIAALTTAVTALTSKLDAQDDKIEDVRREQQITGAGEEQPAANSEAPKPEEDKPTYASTFETDKSVNPSGMTYESALKGDRYAIACLTSMEVKYGVPESFTGKELSR